MADGQRNDRISTEWISYFSKFACLNLNWLH